MRRVLIVPMLLIAVLCGAALAYVAATSLVASRALGRRLDEVRRASALGQRSSQLSAEVDRAVLAYLVAPSAALRARLEAADAERHAVAVEIDRLDLTPRGRALWQQVLAAASLRESQRALLLRAADQRDALAIAGAYTRWDLAGQRAAALDADLGGFNVRRLERAVAELERVRGRALGLLFAVLGASALLVLVFSLFLDRWLVRPLGAMAEAARRIGLEREERPIPGAGRSDELGVLASAIGRMAGDLVRANAELTRSVTARDEFLSIASHELKTPLTSLKLHLQAAQRRWAVGGEPQPGWHAVSLRQLARLESLITDLLDLARIRAGGLQLRRVPVSLSELVPGTLDRMRAVLARSGNELAAEVAEGVTASCDPGRVEQVLTNLLSNAAQHAPGAAVRVELRREGDRAILVVEDAGPGVAPAARERIFARYERAEAGRASSGLGLGLYIARQIVDAHGGHIVVGESALGGAAFAVELPAVAP